MSGSTRSSLSDFDAGGAVDVSVDEGGIRCDWKARHAYIPLAKIADVNVDATIFGKAFLVLVGSDAKELKLHVANASALTIQRLLLVALEEHRAAASSDDDDDLPLLLRRDRSIEAWLGDVGRQAAGTYRDAAFDHDALLKVLANVHANVESRAAAAYALLTNGDESHLIAAMHVFIMHALPPIVLAVAHVAPGGSVLVPDGVAREVAPYLYEDDATALAKLSDESKSLSDEREALLRAALTRAQEEATAITHKEHEEAMRNAPSKRRLHSIAPAGADTRWVGKTWAL